MGELGGIASSARGPTDVSALFAVQSIEQAPYIVKLWFEEKWALLTEEEVEWLIGELRKAATRQEGR
jgi:hypothetical protein